MVNIGLDNYNSDNFLKKLRHYVADDMHQVDAYIANQHSSFVPLISDLTSGLIEAGGKRIRPMLCLLGSRLFSNTLSEPHYYMAAAVEYIHTATLMHDDVIDFSLKRRGKPTVNALYNNKISILVGDFLFARSFQMMTEGHSIAALQLLSRVSSILAEGEVLQLQHLGNMAVTMEDHIKINACKTGALFGAASCVGAILAQQDTAIEEALFSYGEYLGIAFQLFDDILDYQRLAQQDKGILASKNAGDDFFEGKITLPLLLLYQQISPERQLWLDDIMRASKRTKKQLRQVTKLMIQHNIIQKSHDIAYDYGNKAQQQLASIPHHSASDYLYSLVDFAINRDY